VCDGFLHAYHYRVLPNAFENADVLRFYDRAKENALYPEDSYVLKNVREFFAVTASLYLWGNVDRPPHTRAAEAGTHTAESLCGIRWETIFAKRNPGVMGPGSALAVARLSGTTWRDFAKGAETKIRILATAFARALHVHHPQKCRGRREGRVLAAPADPRAKRLRESAKTTGTGGITPAFPCAVVYGLLRALPGEPAFATVIFAMPLELCDNLAPA
jgi:hypothetical protein